MLMYAGYALEIGLLGIYFITVIIIYDRNAISFLRLRLLGAFYDRAELEEHDFKHFSSITLVVFGRLREIVFTINT